jgi:hypothetical protein
MMIVSWDWNAQPNWRGINEALSQERVKTIREVETGQDVRAVVIGAKSAREAQSYFEFEWRTP